MNPIDSYVAIKGATSVTEGEPTNWVPIVIAITLVIAVGLSLFFFLRNRKKKKGGA